MPKLDLTWSNKILSIIKEVNSISATQKFYSFEINKLNVGKIPHPEITSKIAPYLDSEFLVNHECHKISLDGSCSKISEKLNGIAEKLREDKPELIPGWRGEQYPILYPESIGSVERAAADLIFGFEKYGSHLTIFKKKDDDFRILLAKRSKTKSKFPGYWDNSVAGGINYGMSPRECILKEAYEEAGIDDENILQKIVAIGMTSNCYAKTCYMKETQFNYKLDVSEFENFEPKIIDGEVELFKFCSVQEVLDLLVSGNFKPISAIVTIQFLVQKGILTMENTEKYIEIVKGLNNN